MEKMVEWKPPSVLRETDPVYHALDMARLALFRCQRGDDAIDFDEVDRALSAAMDIRFTEHHAPAAN